MKRKIRIDENRWARCGECGHKLFKLNTQMPMHEVMNAFGFIQIEIKCHSCKVINEIGGDECDD